MAIPNALTFISIPEYFEPQFAGLVLSLVNILGRINNAATPMIAEMPEPIPILVCIFFCVMAFFSVTMLKRNENINKVKISNEGKDAADINEKDSQHKNTEKD